MAWTSLRKARTMTTHPGMSLRNDHARSAPIIGTNNQNGRNHVGRGGRKSVQAGVSAQDWDLHSVYQASTAPGNGGLGNALLHGVYKASTATLVQDPDTYTGGDLDDPDLRWILSDEAAEAEEEEEEVGVEEDEGEEEHIPAPRDYYQLLNVQRGASTEDIRNAYRSITKSCHPDVAGDAANDVCTLVTLAYRTLSNGQLRQAYDAELKNYAVGLAGYTGRPLSKWAGAPDEERAVFVDESLCIGCRECAHVASGTFGIEDHWGRARVHTQWGDDEEDIESAQLACPVNCIHYVKRNQLPVLEWCMTRAERGKADKILAGKSTGQDPFDLANSFVRNSPIRKSNEAPADGDVEWSWGSKASDHQSAFSANMAEAWGKLRKKTKLAWSFAHQTEHLAGPRKLIH